MHKICLATKENLEEIALLYDYLNNYSAKTHNYSGWVKNVYPTLETARCAFDEGSLYVLFIESKIVGTTILNSKQPDAYKDNSWMFEALPEEILVVHTLAVHPDFFGQGVASALLDYTLQLAVQKNMKVIRLDTAENNNPASHLYRKKGYTYSGFVDLKLPFELPLNKMYIRFEKRL